MVNLVHLIPGIVLIFEYTAISSALTYAKFYVEYDQPVIGLLGGMVRIGDNLPYDAVPNTVVTLHMLGLFLAAAYLIYFIIYGLPNGNKETIPPQEG